MAQKGENWDTTALTMGVKDDKVEFQVRGQLRPHPVRGLREVSSQGSDGRGTSIKRGVQGELK